MTDKKTTSSEYLGIASYIHTYIKQIISKWEFSELKSSPRSQAYIDRIRPRQIKTQSGLNRSGLNRASQIISGLNRDHIMILYFETRYRLTN